VAQHHVEHGRPLVCRRKRALRAVRRERRRHSASKARDWVEAVHSVAASRWVKKPWNDIGWPLTGSDVARSRRLLRSTPIWNL
jgi:hypothetical protein